MLSVKASDIERYFYEDKINAKRSYYATDKNIYYDAYLRNNLEFLVRRIKKNWDNVILIDGDEGTGKSTFSWYIAYFIAYELGITFTHDNIYYDVEKMFAVAQQKKKQLMILDEAALDLMASDWQEKAQKLLIKLLTVARKNNHTIILIIPEFWRLNRYFVRRAICLLRTYSRDNLTRGTFKAYGPKRKMKLYREEKFLQNSTGVTYPSFFGEFRIPKVEVINEALYNEAKDAAIMSVSEEKSANLLWRDRFFKLLEHIKDNKIMAIKELAHVINLDYNDLKQRMYAFRATKKDEKKDK